MKYTAESIPDYKLASQELTSYFSTLGLEPTTTGGREILTDVNGCKHRAWTVSFQSFTRPAPVVSMHYKTGTGITGRPDPAEVLASSCRDYIDAHRAGSFEDWAAEMGCDTDSRKAEVIYRTYLDLSVPLQKLLSGGKVGYLATERIEKLAELSARL